MGWARPMMRHTGKHIHMRAHTTRALTYSYGFRLAFVWAAVLLPLLAGSLAALFGVGFLCSLAGVLLGLCVLVLSRCFGEVTWDEGLKVIGMKGSKIFGGIRSTILFKDQGKNLLR